MSIMRVRTTLTGWGGGPGLNTFYFTGAGSTPTVGEATEAAARVRAFWNAIRSNFDPGFSAQVSGAMDTIDPSTGHLDGGVVGTTPAVVVGNGTGGFNDFASMALLQLQTVTITRNRRLKGRCFLGPLADGVTTGGLLAAGSVSGIATGALQLTTLILTAVTPQVWQRPMTDGNGFHPGSIGAITGFVCTSKLAVLRSRRD